MRKVIRCKACCTEWIDDSFGMIWDNEKPVDMSLIECCPACGCKEFDEYSEDICYRDSKCSVWKVEILKLFNIFLIASLQSDSPIPSGETFKYCPWCGEEIETDKE